MRLFRRPSTPPQAPPNAGGFGALAAGEYRDVTVLFADLEGFTRMTELLPASEVVSLLNAYFEVMMAAVERHGGQVDKFIGDAMLVVWDGPDPAADAARAVQAALDMLGEVARLQQRMLAEGRRPTKIRIGISSGRAVVGEVGTHRHHERTVIGDAVNTAARLEGLNKEHQTDAILSQATLSLVGDRAVVRDLGLLSIKGRREPVRAHALLGWKETG